MSDLERSQACFLSTQRGPDSLCYFQKAHSGHCQGPQSLVPCDQEHATSSEHTGCQQTCRPGKTKQSPVFTAISLVSLLWASSPMGKSNYQASLKQPIMCSSPGQAMGSGIGKQDDQFWSLNPALPLARSRLGWPLFNWFFSCWLSECLPCASHYSRCLGDISGRTDEASCSWAAGIPAEDNKLHKYGDYWTLEDENYGKM